jgi:hypothetical protein
MFKTSTVIAATFTLSFVALSTFSTAATVGNTPNQNVQSQPNIHFDASKFSENLIINQKPKPKRVVRKRIRFKNDIEISCKEGKLIVARQGFEDVHTLKCQGRNFTYVAMLDGEMRRVDVNRRGDIVGASRF